ncbi:hypothetical protein [Bradyrhizobium sp. CIR3A]|uniref:hypothetical protein n=1 Tax=Bradyrhizobium sp. CIR3A TaxID=2663838 RepID=UPI0016069D1F|nr:hypothetical protein [Bradyrhizobium sp. CIR3A]MBB4264353.1 hypothetical protein [Bradyrhizobium sp. CIR3A]
MAVQSGRHTDAGAQRTKVAIRRAQKRKPTAQELANAFCFATRVFDDCDPKTGVWLEIRDRMVGTPDGRFYLIEGPGIGLDAREVVTPYSFEAVFAWLQDCPEQIERTVIVNTKLLPEQSCA